jgi:hypothetical protein
MAWVRALCCNSVYITHYRSMQIPVSIHTSYFMADKQALVDSGATDNFMHPGFAMKMGLGMKELPTPRKIFNINNTTNKSGKITHYLDLDVYTKGIHNEMHFPYYRHWKRGHTTRVPMAGIFQTKIQLETHHY